MGWLDRARWRPRTGRPTSTSALSEWVYSLSIPCARLAPRNGPAVATSSFIGGHAYLPAGMSWPEIDGLPAAFVGQFNFAEIPPVPGFPTSGLLQWFVSSADDLGGSVGDAADAGVALRWFTDLSVESVAPPDAPTPFTAARDAGVLVRSPWDGTYVDHKGVLVDGDDRRLVPVAARLARMAPHWNDLPTGIDLTPLRQLADELSASSDDLEDVWQSYIRGSLSRFPDLEAGSSVGGSPSFTQSDPRGASGYLPATSSAGNLLVELDSEQFGGWGDGGIGHLFGDPAGLVRGDLTAIRYHWDCL